MTTDNERERAQLERDDARPGEEIALVRVAVSQRDERGRIRQYRILDEPDGYAIGLHLARKAGAKQTLENQTEP